jgi:hypothetical protein
MTDEEMVAYLSYCMIDSNHPRASIKTLLHAFLPYKHVDHTHLRCDYQYLLYGYLLSKNWTTGSPDKGRNSSVYLESLALKYRFVLERTEKPVRKTFSGLHMVGGGIHNIRLCQFTANAIGRPIWKDQQKGQ